MNNSYLSEYSHGSTNTSQQGQMIHLHNLYEFQKKMNNIQIQTQQHQNPHLKRSSNNWFKSESDNSEQSYNPSSLQSSLMANYQDQFENKQNQSSKFDYLSSSNLKEQQESEQQLKNRQSSPIRFQNLNKVQAFVFPSAQSKSQRSSLSKYEQLLNHLGDESSLNSFKKSMEKYSFNDQCLRSFSPSRIDSKILDEVNSNSKNEEQQNKGGMEIEVPDMKQGQLESIKEQEMEDQECIFQIKENQFKLNSEYESRQKVVQEEFGIREEKQYENETDGDYEDQGVTEKEDENFCPSLGELNKVIKIEEKKEGKPIKRNRKNNAKKKKNQQQIAKEKQDRQERQEEEFVQQEGQEQPRRNPPRKRRNPGVYRPDDFLTNIDQIDESYLPHMETYKIS